MKELFEWIVIAITLLTALLTFGMVVTEFTKIDTTLIAGIIAFAGAIVGGLITLIGVTRTIEANKTIENKKRIKDELMFLYPLKREIEKIRDDIAFDFYENHSSDDEMIRKLHRTFPSNSELFNYAQHGSLEVYSKLDNFKWFVNTSMERIYFDGEIIDATREEVFSAINDRLNEIEKTINIEIESKENILQFYNK